jgi:pimeloyl-ACP methyl ester carboxylesterase
MTNLQSTPLLQALEVAGRTVRREIAGRGDGLVHAVTRQPLERPAPVGWRVVNLDLAGRNFRYRVTDNDDAVGPHGPGSEPIWAINVHGYFAGGSMYARESERLAERLGWRVVNPSLPGFGGSAPLDWGEITINALSDHIDIVRRELGIGRFVLLGHSMGGAVAIDYAARHARDVLGVIYRDGVATPEWQQRRGWPVRLFGSVLPDVAPMIDLMSAVALDAPDLLIGHLFATIKALIPDLRSNVKTVAHSAPVATMLMNLDLTDAVRRLAATGVPIYGAWGCFDRVVTSPAAASFARAAGVEIQWVPGGHSWMLARPSGQSDLLTVNPSGVAFNQRVLERYDAMRPRARLRSVS